MNPAVRDLFDAMGTTYHELEPWYEHLYFLVHRILQTHLGRSIGGRALDAGCGTGFQAGRLAELGWEAHGVDISGGLLAVARRHVPQAALTWATVERLPYADASFEVAVCCGSTLSFVDHPPRALAELARVLRGGGRLLLECEHRPSLDLGWTLASALAGDRLGYGVPVREAWHALVARADVRIPYPGYGMLRLFTRRELHAMLGAAGFAPIREWGVHSITNLIPSPLLHRARLPGPLATAYRVLRRLDAALAPTRPGRALANSVVILAERAQPAA
jgi:SAM-dependent methyltransferase